MAKETIKTDKSPQLSVICQGNLKITGWFESNILAKGDSFESSEEDKGLIFESAGDLNLLVPSDATLVVIEVGGDFSVKGISGEMIAHDIRGDARLRNISKMTIDKVNGDLTARNVADTIFVQEVMGDMLARNTAGITATAIYGDCSTRSNDGQIIISSVMGDTNLISITGDVNIEKCHRDVNLQGIEGKVTIDRAEGDIRLRGGLSEGKHNLRAGGDIVVRWPFDMPLYIEATAPQIKNSLPLIDIVEKGGTLIGRLAEGQTYLSLIADRGILLRSGDSPKHVWQEDPATQYDYELELDRLGDKISAEINQRINEWSKQMEGKFGEDIAYQIERSAEKAATRAERAAEKAMRRAEKAAQKASWHAARGSWSEPTTSNQSSSKEKRATEEEQLKILHMVENGVISPDEATELLEALEY